MLALLVLHRAKLLASNQSILALGRSPRQVVSHLCHCIVQWLCVADCKHPCLVRGGRVDYNIKCNTKKYGHHTHFRVKCNYHKTKGTEVEYEVLYTFYTI